MSSRTSHRSLQYRKTRSLLLESLEQRLPFDAAVGSLAVSYIDRAADSVDFFVPSSSSLKVAPILPPYSSTSTTIPINPEPISSDFAQFASVDDWREAIVQRQVAMYEQTPLGQRYDDYNENFTWDPDPTDNEAPWTIARVWGDGSSAHTWTYISMGSLWAASDVSFANSLNSTPVQVAGIDEGDIVETDGRYIFTLQNSGLVVIDTQTTGEEKIVGRIQLDPNYGSAPRDMYLHDGKLTIISSASRYAFNHAEPLTLHEYQHHRITTIETFNVENPENIVLEEKTEIEGDYQQSRMDGDRLVIVTNNSQPWLNAPTVEWVAPIYGEEEIPVSALPEGYTLWEGQTLRRVLQEGYSQYETREHYLERIRSEAAQLSLPRMGRVDTTLETPTTYTELVTTENWYLPPGEAWTGSQIYTVTSLDTNAPLEAVSSFSVGINQLSALYMSETGVYLASSQGGAINNFWGGIDWTITTSSFSSETKLFKFSYADDGQLAPPQEITLQGSVQNQFWMDEQHGDLRVVTSSPTGPMLYVLRSDNEGLQTVSTLENFSPNEEVYSVRYAGDKAFVVTFPTSNGEINYQRVQRIDPLFVIDLSNPEQPTVLGELEIPGFSDYLLPIDDTHLLGVGRNVDPETGADLGLQVSVFDVTDWSSPELVSRYSFEGGASTQTQGIWNNWWGGQATLKHHAFNYLPEQRLFAIPIYTMDWTGNAGAGIFERSNEAAVRLLKINEYGELSAVGEVLFTDDFAQNLQQRTFSIGDSLYFVSPHAVKVSNVEEPATVIDTVHLDSLIPYDPLTDIWPIRNWEAEVQESIRIAETLGLRPEETEFEPTVLEPISPEVVIDPETLPVEETMPSEIDANEIALGEIDPMILQATGVLENFLVEEVLPVEWFTEFLELEQPNIEPEALDDCIPWVSLPASMEMETSPKESVPELWEELSAVTSTEEVELLVDTPALPSLLADDDFALLFASYATAPETTLADENDDTLLVYLAFAARLNRFTVSAASQQSKLLEFLKTEEATCLHHELNVTLVNMPQ